MTTKAGAYGMHGGVKMKTGKNGPGQCSTVSTASRGNEVVRTKSSSHRSTAGGEKRGEHTNKQFFAQKYTAGGEKREHTGSAGVCYHRKSGFKIHRCRLNSFC